MVGVSQNEIRTAWNEPDPPAARSFVPAAEAAGARIRRWTQNGREFGLLHPAIQPDVGGVSSALQGAGGHPVAFQHFWTRSSTRIPRSFFHDLQTGTRG